MKLIVRSAGSMLVAVLAVAIVISLIAYSLVPELSRYIKDTFPEEKNVEFVSGVALDPDVNHAFPVDGEVYETSHYIYTYDSVNGGWRLSVKDKNRGKYSPICTTVYNQPVISLEGAFEGCNAMTQAPAIPATVVDLTSAFSGCSSLSGVMVVYATPSAYDNCFKGTVQSLTLLGDSLILPKLAETSSAGNIILN